MLPDRLDCLVRLHFATILGGGAPGARGFGQGLNAEERARLTEERGRGGGSGTPAPLFDAVIELLKAKIG